MASDPPSEGVARPAGQPAGASPPGEDDQISITVATTGRTVRLDRAPSLFLGRRDAAIGVVPQLDLSDDAGFDHGVSRLHAALLCEGDQLLVVDLDSTNGTLLNGVRLAPQVARRLHDGDQITLGRLALAVHFVERAQSEPQRVGANEPGAPLSPADPARPGGSPQGPGADEASESGDVLPDAVHEFIDRYCSQLLDVRLLLALYERAGAEYSFSELASALKCSLADLAVRLQPLVAAGIVVSRGPSTAVRYALSAEVLERGAVRALDSAYGREGSRRLVEARLRQNSRKRE